MAKNRQISDGIWDQDWFLDLPNDYKAFYLFLLIRGCDHAGIWTVSRRYQIQATGNKIIHFDDFIRAVNKDEIGGEPTNRIIVLNKYKWFIPQYIIDNYQGKFQPKNKPHQSMLKILTFHKVDLESVPNFDWSALKTQAIDFQETTNIGDALPIDRQPVGDALAIDRQPIAIDIDTDTEKDSGRESEKGIVKGKNENEKISQNPLPPKNEHLNGHHPVNGSERVAGAEKVFALQSIYQKSWPEMASLSISKGMSEKNFSDWKRFVDFVRENHFTDLFETKFIKPQDWKAMEDAGFTDDLWAVICRKMCSSGVNPNQNLFHRIPQFLADHFRPKTRKPEKTGVDITGIDYDEVDQYRK